MHNYGLFIGMTSVSNYSNSEFDPTNFIDNIINKTFSGFRAELKYTLKNEKDLNKNLYEPISFYAFGSYNLITLSLIDDFHFGNFSFRPFNKYINPEHRENSNFQYQVINNFNLEGQLKYDLKEFEEKRFICVCKIKINSCLLIGNGIEPIKKIKKYLTKQTIPSTELIVGESFSWHELTLTFLGNSIEDIFQFIQKIRNLTLDENIGIEINENSLVSKFKFNKKDINIFSDTESIFGKNTKFFNKKSDMFDTYMKEVNALENPIDNNIFISTKVHTKTGHENQIRSFLKEKNLLELIGPMQITNGQSDLSLKFKDKSTLNYIEFWRRLLHEEGSYLGFDSQIRKMHSNISLKFPEGNQDQSIEQKTESLPKTKSTTLVNNNSDLCTYSAKNIFEALKFNSKTVIEIEEKLKKIKITKELTNKIITLYTNFNDLICDINLYMYYIDLKSLLLDLDRFIMNYDISDDNIHNRKVYGFSDMLIEYIDVFEKAFQNRFLDSKRYGYNIDMKGDFNGGVHQIIQAYDSAYKIVAQKLSLAADGRTELPIVSYGGYAIGIKSNRINLNLNYFQLFQPEFFLFSLVKENLNFFLDKLGEMKDDDGSNFNQIFKDLRITYAKMIHDEPNISKKELLFEYLPPSLIDKKLFYILAYYLFIFLQWFDDIETYIFWYWHTYLQNSNAYNIDGSLRIDMFKEHYFAFYVAIKTLKGDDFIIDEHLMSKLVKSYDVLFYLFDEKSNVQKETVETYLILKKEESFINCLHKFEEIFQNIKLKMLDENDRLYEKLISEITVANLRDIKETIINSGGTLTTFIRDTEYAKGIENLNNKYCDSVFDSHGGIFTIEPKARIEILKLRIKLINELRDISYKYKIKLINIK